MRRIALAFLIFVIVFTTLRVLRYRQTSATWDEPIHLTAGYAAIAHRDFRVEPGHPPFMREWAALPLLVTPHRDLDTTEIDRTAVPAWVQHAYDVARRFLYTENDADLLLYRARFMVVLWGLALGALLFAWAYEWLGFTAAATVLAFYTFEPNLSAHAALVTTDFGVTCFMFGAVYFLWRLCRRFTPAGVVALALCVALAAITKYSSVVLAPILVLLAVVAVRRRTELTWRRATIVLAAVAATTLLAVWAAYGFRYRPSASAEWLFSVSAIPGADTMPRLAAMIGWVDAHRLLPNAYSEGFLLSVASIRELPAFMAGEIRLGGWWYYFPVAFVLKTPVALLALFAGGVITMLRRRRRDATLAATFVLVPVAAYLLVAMVSGINVGIRHILPVYPFVLLVATAAMRELYERRRSVARVAAACVVVAWAAEFARAYPDTLSFFNVLAGGPKNGYRYLADSNLGWGANLKPLKRWMDRHGVREINLAYFGSADPQYYHIDATYLPGSATYLVDRVGRPRLPGYVAISPTILDGVYLLPSWRIFYAGFREREPAAIIGHSIRVYWVETWPEAPAAFRTDPVALTSLGDGLLTMEWPEHAIGYYRDALARDPRNGEGWNSLGVAFTRTGHYRQAAQSFARARDLLPGNPTPRRNLAAVLPYVTR